MDPSEAISPRANWWQPPATRPVALLRRKSDASPPPLPEAQEPQTTLSNIKKRAQLRMEGSPLRGFPRLCTCEHRCSTCGLQSGLPPDINAKLDLILDLLQSNASRISPARTKSPKQRVTQTMSDAVRASGRSAVEGTEHPDLAQSETVHAGKDPEFQVMKAALKKMKQERKSQKKNTGLNADVSGQAYPHTKGKKQDQSCMSDLSQNRSPQAGITPRGLLAQAYGSQRESMDGNLDPHGSFFVENLVMSPTASGWQAHASPRTILSPRHSHLHSDATKKTSPSVAPPVQLSASIVHASDYNFVQRTDLSPFVDLGAGVSIEGLDPIKYSFASPPSQQRHRADVANRKTSPEHFDPHQQARPDNHRPQRKGKLRGQSPMRGQISTSAFRQGHTGEVEEDRERVARQEERGSERVHDRMSHRIKDIRQSIVSDHKRELSLAISLAARAATSPSPTSSPEKDRSASPPQQHFQFAETSTSLLSDTLPRTRMSLPIPKTPRQHATGVTAVWANGQMKTGDRKRGERRRDPEGGGSQTLHSSPHVYGDRKKSPRTHTPGAPSTSLAWGGQARAIPSLSSPVGLA